MQTFCSSDDQIADLALAITFSYKPTDSISFR